MTILKKQLIFITILSIVIHSISLYFLIKSPLLFYNSISGLDMPTIINFGKSFYEGKQYFSIQKAIIALNILLFGGTFNPLVHIIVHYFLGLLISILTVLSARLLFRNDLISLLSGVFVTLYAPAIMYESFVLKETIYCFFCFLSLFSLLVQRQYHNKVIQFFAGFCFITPFFVRDSSIIWLFFGMITLFLNKPINLNNVKLVIKEKKAFFIGCATIFLIVFSINIYNRSNILPTSIFNKSYNFQVGLQVDPTSINLASTKKVDNVNASQLDLSSKLFSVSKIYFNKLLQSLKAFEITNNLNYYFIVDKLFPLSWLIQPLFLIPLALSGFILLLRRSYLRKHSLTLYLYLVSFLIPMVVFLPLSRYKIVLYPIFSIMAAYFVVFIFLKLKKKASQKKAFAYILTYIIVLYLCIPNGYPIRASDFFTHGLAIKFKNRSYTKTVGICYQKAFELEPSPKYALIWSYYLLATRNFKVANEVLVWANSQEKNNHKIEMNLAITYLALKKPKQAENLLLNIKQQDGEHHGFDLYYNLGECFRMQNKPDQAVSYYKLAMQYCKVPQRKKQIEQIVESINKRNNE